MIRTLLCYYRQQIATTTIFIDLVGYFFVYSFTHCLHWPCILHKEGVGAGWMFLHALFCCLGSFTLLFVLVTIVTETESDGKSKMLQFSPEQEVRVNLPMGAPFLLITVWEQNSPTFCRDFLSCFVESSKHEEKTNRNRTQTAEKINWQGLSICPHSIQNWERSVDYR